MHPETRSDDLSGGHEFARYDRAPWRRCARCGALVAGRRELGYMLDSDPAGRDGPFGSMPRCAPDVEDIISPLLN